MVCGLGLIQGLLWLVVGGHREGKTFSKVWAEISGMKAWEPHPFLQSLLPLYFSCVVQWLPRSAAGLMSFPWAEGEKETQSTSIMKPAGQILLFQWNKLQKPRSAAVVGGKKMLWVTAQR